MLLSWQASAVNLALTCFCLLACFKLAHFFDVEVMTLLQKSSSSHPPPCQQSEGTVQIWLYPLSDTGVVQCPAAEMLVQLGSTLWHLSGKCLGTGWVTWGTVWHKHLTEIWNSHVPESTRDCIKQGQRAEGWRGRWSVIQVGHVLT